MTTVFMMDEKNYRNAPAALGQIAVRAATSAGLVAPACKHGVIHANVIIWVQSIEAHAGHMAPSNVGEWLSLVEHLVRDQGVGGSNPLSPTNLSLSVPETWVTERSGDMGYTFGPKGFSRGCKVFSSRST